MGGGERERERERERRERREERKERGRRPFSDIWKFKPGGRRSQERERSEGGSVCMKPISSSYVERGEMESWSWRSTSTYCVE